MEIIITLLCTIVYGITFNEHNGPDDMYSLSCIMIISISVLVFTIRKFREYGMILIVAYVLRLIILFADYFGWFHVLYSGMDTEMFYHVSLNIMENKSFEDTLIVTNYSYFTGSFFMLLGPQRLFVQYMNVLLGMGVLFYTCKSLKILGVNRKIMSIFVYIACLLPHFIIFSGILLREAIVEFSVAASLYFFLRWFLNENGIISFFVSFIFILLGASMHSGVLLILVGYLGALLFYNKSRKKISFTISSLLLGTIAILLISFVIFEAGVFTDKFSKLENLDSMEEYEILAHRKAGSTYLRWLDVKGTKQILLFSPLKMFYFLFSPIPLDWRGISDIIAFFFDSVVYFLLFWGIFRRYKKIVCPVEKRLVLFLSLSLFFVIFTYSYGTSVAGTAIRHRAKIMPLLLVTAAICYNRKGDNRLPFVIQTKQR